MAQTSPVSRLAHLRRAAAEVPGLAARRAAVELLDNVIRRHRALDEQLDGADGERILGPLDDRDRALVRKLVGTALRRLGTLRALIGAALHHGVPKDAPRLEPVLLIAAVQILWLDIPDHAAVDLAVRLVQADRRTAPFAGLVNAVLRRIAREGQAMLAGFDPVVPDTPEWLMARWSRTYGTTTARAIAAMHAVEPSLDLSVKADPTAWAARLRGRVLPTGTVRTVAEGRVSRMPGFAEGAWWVQDAAAALPVRLLGEVAGRDVADLCAAPGGKTAQLVSLGARVTAVDRSPARAARLEQNLKRLRLNARIVIADATEWQGGPFHAVLVDPPCLSTGTIRRHPDIAWLKQETDLAPLLALQARLLHRAAALLVPGGTLIYCACSLEPEEGEQQIAALLDREPNLRRHPIAASEVAGLADLLSPAGDLRTLPSHLPDPEPRLAGLDGFYAARLARS
jgi:16S rRNA (cytosine967-C5)-methyltransferase